jgi:exoribonuclease II
MSEITTGAVPLSLIGAPLAIGSACVDAVYFAAKYCVDQHKKMLDEIEKGNERLKWLDKQTVSSPLQIMEEANRLQKMVSEHSLFYKMTKGISAAQKNILSGAIVMQHSPLKAYVPAILKVMAENENAFQVALKQGTKNLALDNFKFVNDIVKDAANATGFKDGTKILKQTESVTDTVFSDKFNRKFTAYCQLDKQMNPSLALDLEGFACDTNECSTKMDEIVNYLQAHGVPFSFKKVKHNQPTGVLRKILNKRSDDSNNKELGDYLHRGNNAITTKNKQKLP